MTTAVTPKPTDRVTIIYGRPNYRPTLFVGTVHGIDATTITVQSDVDRGSAFGSILRRDRIRSIEIHEQPPVCTEFKGTGSRCTECRYRKDFH